MVFGVIESAVGMQIGSSPEGTSMYDGDLHPRRIKTYQNIVANRPPFQEELETKKIGLRGTKMGTRERTTGGVWCRRSNQHQQQREWEI